MEDKNGRSALSQGTVVTPTKVKATLVSIPIATESLINRRVSSMSIISIIPRTFNCINIGQVWNGNGVRLLCLEA